MKNFLIKLIQFIIFLFWIFILTILFILFGIGGLIIGIVISIGAFIIFGGYLTTDKEDDTKKIYKEYVNEKLNFKIKYPENFKFSEGFLGSVIALGIPRKSIFDLFQFQGNLNLVVQNLSESMTLNEYSDLSLTKIKEYYNKNDLNILEYNETTLDKIPAHKLLFTRKEGMFNIKQLAVYTIINNTSYILTYTDDIDKFDKNLNKFSKIIDSFHFLE